MVWGLLGYGATFVAIGGAAALTSLLTASSTPPEGNGTVDAIVPLVRHAARRVRGARAS